MDMAGRQEGPSAFSTYASRFLAGGVKGREREVQGSQIFHPPSPSSSAHDPFVLSPSSSSHPRLPGSSRSPSPSPSLVRGELATPPFPGMGIDEIPDIEDGGLGTGLLFGGSSVGPPASRPVTQRGASQHMARGPSGNSNSRGGGSGVKAGIRKTRIPNPYEASSESEEEDEIEPDLDEVAARRSLAGLRPGVTSQVNRYPSRPPSDAVRPPVQSDRARKGWLAHQSVFPPSSSSSDDESESEKETEEDTDDERERRLGADGMRDGISRMMGQSRAQGEGKGRAQSRSASSRAPRGYMLSPSELYEDSMLPGQGMYAGGVGDGGGEMADTMDQPLLEPDEMDRRPGKVPTRLQVYHGRFGHWEREGLRKYKDTGVLALWLTSLIAVMFGLLFVWGATDPPPGAPSHRQAPSLVPLLPLLLVLLIPPLIVPPAFLFLLQHTVRPVLTATAVSIPLSLFLCGWWALGASFETSGWDGIDSGERWWGTSGLRILAVLLWGLAAFFGRLVWIRRKRLERTVAVVELSTELLLSHPPLLLLTPLLLAVFALASIPFLTLLVRLAMIGYWRHPREGTYIYQIAPRAGWLIALVTTVWVWTWGVIRGVGRVAVAGVIGEWYFHRNDPHHPPPLEITQAALHRATGTSLGSICIGAGIVAIARIGARASSELRRLTSPKNKLIPPWLTFVSRLTPLFAIAAGVLDQLNGYALVYVGITGEAFWPSARRAVGLAGRRKGGHLLDYTLIKLLLTLASTAMGMFTATAGYLYMAHSLSNPAYAPVAGVLCGGVPFLAVRAGASVLGDAADALFICHQIDREMGGSHSEQAKEAFSTEKRTVGAAAV